MKLNILFLNNRKTLFKYFLIGKYILYFLILLLKNIFFHQDNMGIGVWGLGIGDWGLGPIPNPQSP